jgi:hypothetical protein
VQKTEPKGEELILTRSIPKKFHAELTEFLGKRKRRGIGSIQYKFTHGEAESERYHPKSEFNRSLTNPTEARGLGYYLETIAVNDVKERKWLKGARTTWQPSVQRIGQLHKAGLIELNEKEKELLRECREASDVEFGKKELELINILLRNGKLPIRHSFEEWLHGLGRGLRASLKRV